LDFADWPSEVAYAALNRIFVKIRKPTQGHQATMAITHFDTNQIRARIGDLKERVASLRGYL
jgi:hypothetical protein